MGEWLDNPYKDYKVVDKLGEIKVNRNLSVGDEIFRWSSPKHCGMYRVREIDDYRVVCDIMITDSNSPGSTGFIWEYMKRAMPTKANATPEWGHWCFQDGTAIMIPPGAKC